MEIKIVTYEDKDFVMGIDKYVNEIGELIVGDKIPEVLNKGKCKKCAYYEYCYI